jgi:UDP-N-acetylglucosamine 2-epimerase (hydrolysing)
MKKKIVFITGTRADYGKIKNVIQGLQSQNYFNVSLFVTGIHNLKDFGSTYLQIISDNIKNITRYNNQKFNEPMDKVFYKTCEGFSSFIKKEKPDLVIVHGDRAEALACAITACLNGIKVGHIEGGEVSGTVDEILRHSISKIANLHFVANEKAKKRLIQLGEDKKNIYVTGSPDIDVLLKSKLPSIDSVKKKYSINFKKYSIAVFHPVTTEFEKLDLQLKEYIVALKESGLNYVLILPNNDFGVKKILNYYKKITSNNFRKLPSMRFECYLSLLKNSEFIIGNSSSGIIEAPYFGVKTINIGSRQKNRSKLNSIINCNFDKIKILNCIKSLKIKKSSNKIKNHYGNGESKKMFLKVLKQKRIWNTSNQKFFKDLKF